MEQKDQAGQNVPLALDSLAHALPSKSTEGSTEPSGPEQDPRYMVVYHTELVTALAKTSTSNRFSEFRIFATHS